jgi:hypothetical protein
MVKRSASAKASADSPPAMFTTAEPWEIREEFEQLVIGDIRGPAFGPDEILPADPVRDRYLVGMLAPREVRVDPAQVDDDGQIGGDSEGDADGSPRIGEAGYFPSSLGLSFAVDGIAAAIRVEAEWGHYRKERRLREELDTLPGFFIDSRDKEKEKLAVWQRYPRSGTVTVRLHEGMLGPFLPVPVEHPDVVIRGKARRHKKHWLVTLFLVNEQIPTQENIDQQWLFQASLSLSATDSSEVFLERSSLLGAEESDEAELAQLAMLYRNELEFAVGHGTAVHAERGGNDPTRAVILTTENVPTFRVPGTAQPDITMKPPLADLERDMKTLSMVPDAEFPRVLSPVVTAYRTWLADQEKRVPDPAARLSEHTTAAHDAIVAAREVASRIERGIELLSADPNAAEAFRFANEAMWRQRIQSLAIRHRRSEMDRTQSDVGLPAAIKVVDIPKNRSWRVFQIAFLLLNLPALTDPKHADRRGDAAAADLLFFPTGGGKTEAYLGLVAYTFAIRRLQGVLASDDGALDGAEGVAVFMRYTLRLLTSQQFQRAAALVCACEVARRERLPKDARWGTTPFRLGLWIGASTTPNFARDSRAAIETAHQRDGSTGGYASPLQLTACPWCGSPLTIGANVKYDEAHWRTLTMCSDPFGRCPFTDVRSPGEGIPVVTVDEDIYRLLPAFIIATVDKFAQLPWRGPLHLLFGRTYSRCDRHGFRSRDLDRISGHVEADSHPARHGAPAAKTVSCGRLRPPDLIIQDELHLISGPLGTMVGLYETVVDRLASMRIGGVTLRPKVVASTATIRRASIQANAIFHRRLNVFPPPVLDVTDNFFSEQKDPSPQTPDRRYVGVCARGHRLKAAEARLVMSILAAAQLLFDKYGPAADPYMTLVGYFSSLRELAGMRRLLDDDVQQRLPKVARRGLGNRPRYLAIGELTSRIRSDQIPKLLDRLFLTHAPGAKKSTTSGPFDVVLATNMISVGVDVPRLGVMLTVGQPKSTAEYIQATSRVGRDVKGPGVVFTLYNWSRPRDLSHYERFEYDHATFYRYVEALSVTPFSRRALDRGLTALAISLIRQEHAGDLLGATTNPEMGAQTTPLTLPELRQTLDAIADRMDGIIGDPARSAELRSKLDELLDVWLGQQRSAIKNSAPLSYGGREKGTAALLHTPQPYKWTRWTVPNSLRETEHTVNLLLSTSDASAGEDQPWVLTNLRPNQAAAPTLEALDPTEDTTIQ